MVEYEGQEESMEVEEGVAVQERKGRDRSRDR